MRYSSWCSAPLFALAVTLAAGCSDDPECTTDGGCDQPDGAVADGGMDSISRDSDSPDINVPDGGTPDVGAPDVVVIPTGPDDYTLCDSTLDCPAGRGRCLLNLPLHHPDSAGNALVAVSDVFADVPEGRGVCAESCESSPGACGTSEFLADAPNYTCQVVYAAPTPYALGGVDDEAMRAGDSFAALCRPSFSGAANRLPETCGACASDAECGAGRCWDLASGAPHEGEEEGGRCVEDCSAELPCAQGFSCQTTSAGDLCLPILATCESCVDADGDGFGLGFCDPETSSVTPVDCDDAEATAYYEAEPMCGAVDHNCNGFADEADMVGTDLYGGLHCSACDDGCSDEAQGDLVGSQWECVGDEGARTCEATCETGRLDCDMDGACEVDGTSAGFQWAPDADNDGAPCNPEPGRETCVVITACTRPTGMVRARDYSADPYLCPDATCPDADDDDDNIWPEGPELCDARDNNQNGTVDEIFAGAGARACLDGDTAEPCRTGSAVPLRGRCTTSCSGGSLLLGRWQCSESGVACVADSSGAEVACNGIDDNCNGRVDEPVGDACDSGGLDSPCRRRAALRCSGGLSCVPASASAYASVHDAPGDNYDADCDGVDGEADAIYVYSASVVPGEDGTATRPYRNLRAALDQADLPGGSDTIYVQSAPGVPVLLDDGPIDLRAGLRIYGGFTGALAWNYSGSDSNVCIPSNATPVTHTESVLVPGRVIPPSTVVPPSSVNLAMRAHIGLRCEGLTGTAAPAVVSQIALAVTGCGTGAAPAPSQVGGSVYGGIFIDCENVILRDLTVTNGAAGAGQAGTTPAQQTALGPWLGGRGGFGTGSSLLGLPGNGPNGGPPASGVGADGGWPSGGGSRGAPAVDPQPFPALPTAPMVGNESFYLTRDGFLEHRTFAPHQGFSGAALGLESYGSGGGGGGAQFNTPAPYPGGNGGTGGGPGAPGDGGYAGGNNVALVLLGTQLPARVCPDSTTPPTDLTPNFAPCGSDVDFNGGSSGAGGAGSVGGQGANGGNGAFSDPPAGGEGGGGGGGCGGGGGGGGSAGAAAGLLHDISSSGAADRASWLSYTAGDSGARGIGASQGADGTAGNTGDVVAPPGTAACTGMDTSPQGEPGMTTARSSLPMLSCGDLSAVDTQDIDADQWVLGLSGGLDVIPTATAATCAPQ